MKPVLTAVTLATILIAAPVFAGERTLSQTFAYQGETLYLDVGVGEVEIEAGDGDEVSVEVVLTPAKGSGWLFGGKTDISEVELNTKITEGKRLVLSLNDNDDIKEHWRITLPADAAVSVDMGVGRIATSGLDNSLEIDLGVGEVQVNHSHDYGSISLHSGVGEVNFLRNGQQQPISQALVSQSFQSQSSGTGKLKVDVGVGEVGIQQL